MTHDDPTAPPGGPLCNWYKQSPYLPAGLDGRKGEDEVWTAGRVRMKLVELYAWVRHACHTTRKPTPSLWLSDLTPVREAVCAKS